MTVHFDSSETSDRAAVVSLAPAYGRTDSLYAAFGKRILDLSLVVLFSPVLIPVILIITVSLLIVGTKPFFSQDRIGKGGRVFRMIKFRSMVQNADAVLEEYLASNPGAREEWLVHQKLKSDPRVTSVGRFLRKTSLDELPQILNVISGHMSLVGPRPMLVHQEKMYPGEAYYALRPGITGYWQISDRNDCAFRQRADYDTRYAYDVSLSVDMIVLAHTASTVVRGTGY